MLLVVDIKPHLQREADVLVPERYESLDELINVALRNQLAMEKAHGHVPRDSVGVLADRPAAKARPADAGRDAPAPAAGWRDMLRRVDGTAVGPAGAAPVRRQPGANLWGQVNRLLPVAAGLRVLGNMLVANEQQAVLVADWHREAAGVATELRHHLLTLDRKAQRGRGELWSTGLPNGERPAFRRYTTQFLGGSRSGEAVPGAAEQLGFIEVVGESPARRVGLTTAGVLWTSLANPVFDGAAAKQTFDIDEVRFYLEHIERYLPLEHEFMRTLAELIERKFGREELDQALVELYPGWESVAATMRAGGIGRLHDLGLLHRVRSGQFVNYSLTELARTLGFGTAA